MSSAESQTTVESGKPTLQMDRLLDVVVKQDASDLHLSCGRPPTIRLSGRLRNLATKTLEPEDMMQLMKSVTPEKNQQELQEKGSTDFGFAFGTAARFRVSVFKQKGVISMVLRQIPNRLLSFEQIGLPEICKDLIRENKTFRIDSAIQTGKKFGMQLLDDHLWSLYSKGMISAEEMIDKCRNPGDMTEKVHRAGGNVGRAELDEKHEG